MSRHLSEEHKLKLSEGRMGKNNPFYGRKHTKETLKKMSKALCGRVISDKTRKKLSEAGKGQKGSFYGRNHTKESLKKMSDSKKGKYTGKNNSNWNLNLTDEERKANRHSSTNKAWRKKVYKRDNYICKCCGAKGVDVEAHHLENFSDNPTLRTDVDNGITLCKNCHLQFHMFYGFHHTTLEQTLEFING